MSHTIYISDLDGTLLNSDSRISPQTASILSSLAGQGAMITVATARTPATVQPLLEGCGITVPAVVLTGAALWDFSTQSYIHPIFMADEEYRRVMEVFRSAGYMPFVYELPENDILRVYHIPPLNRAEAEFYEQRKHLQLKRFIFDGIPDSGNRIILLFGTGPKPLVHAIAQRLRQECDCSVSAYPDIFDPDVALIEVFAPGVNKAAAIRRLARHAGADRVVVFGDNLNDLPMMREADLSVAVANGLPEVRREADLVIGANVDNSVAKFISYDFQKA